MYTGALSTPSATPPRSTIPPHLALRDVSRRLEGVLAGFPSAQDDISHAITELLTYMLDPLLPALELQEVS